MKDMCCIDGFSPTSSSEIKAYLIKNLDYGTVLRNFKMVDQKNL